MDIVPLCSLGRRFHRLAPVVKRVDFAQELSLCFDCAQKKSVPACQRARGNPYELPLRQLAAGEYLPLVTVVAGKRDVGFTVR